jgi:hypothetical protein
MVLLAVRDNRLRAALPRLSGRTTRVQIVTSRFVDVDVCTSVVGAIHSLHVFHEHVLD